MTVKAPYHFVPLSKWVLLPDWAHLVSHDIPFEDGLCGTIDYTLTNASPLLVGNEHESQEDGSTLVKWARDPDDRPIIPGSSIKGMIRSVMEIATFSKMGQVEDKTISYRNFNVKEYTKLIKNNTQAAWLKFNKNSEHWEVFYAEHASIEERQLNRYFESESDQFSHSEKAIQKYEKFNLNSSHRFNTIPTTEDKVPEAIHIGHGETTGQFVFTDERVDSNENSNLKFEYIFYNKSIEKHETTNHEILKKRIKDFFHCHDQDLIKYLKSHQHSENGIPVFLKISKDNEILAIGTSKLPRVSYDNSIHKLLKKQQQLFGHQPSYDFTEGLMGTIRKEGLSLKSRLSFSDLNNEETIDSLKLKKEVEAVLMSPKESYFPAYLENTNGNTPLENYNNENSILKGTKVYPRNKSSQLISETTDENNESDNSQIVSKLELLEIGCQFKGKINFHNIKPEELGAILWCLTFGEIQHQKYQHGLGHAKPYGAGNIMIDLEAIDVISNNSNEESTDSSNSLFDKFINCFVSYMEQNHFANDWLNSPQIQHLLSFSEPRNDVNLTYMPLEGDNDSYTSDDNLDQMLPDWKSVTGESLSRVEEMLTVKNTKNQKSNCGRGRLSILIKGEEREGNKVDVKNVEVEEKGKPIPSDKWEKLKQQLNRK